MFKNMKIGYKIGGGFGLVIGLFLIIIGLYQFVISTSSTGFQNLFEQELVIGKLSGDINELMLQCRRNEKDFLIRLDKKYADKLEKNIVAIVKKAREIETLAKALGKAEAIGQASAIITSATAYHDHFQSVVASWEIQGLDHKSGLQGEFRNAARKLATDLKDHQIDDLYIALLQMRRYEKDYFRTKADKYKKRFLDNFNTYTALLEKSTCEKNSKKIQREALSSYMAAFNTYLENKSSQEKNYKLMRSNASLMEKAITDVLLTDSKALLLDIRKNEKDYLLRSDEKYYKATLASIDKLLSAATNTKMLQKHIGAVKNVSDTYKIAFESLVKEKRHTVALSSKMRKAVYKIEPLVDSLYMQSDKDSHTKETATINKVKSLAKLAISIGVCTIIIGVLLALFITRAVTKPINHIIAGLNDGANQVASASGQVSSASQSLASGSSQQAASLEETSSSMEEMSSMTRKNSENAGQADTLMKEANQVVNVANESMGKVIQSMDDISKASEETSKIIKTIDEIAFQTNLLALNAAVEAARAGEAGAGFAVVADEVRNLAMRAADAAKNTAELIEGTVKRINDGSELVSTTNEAFSQVANSTSKVGDLVSEISEASKEQSNGIEQVNIAIAEMDKVVQQNAANAEETASGSEEMSAQAEQLKDYVGELVALVTGNTKQGTSDARAIPHQTISRKPMDKKLLAQSVREVNTDKVIPFDDDSNFKDF